jgi:protein gp37
MSDATKIEWTDFSWSPWEGCTKVSPGCLNCYAEARDKRHLIEPVDHWGKGAPRRRTKDWKKPLAWNRAASKPVAVNYGCTDDLGEPAKAFYRPRVFPSVCDWLDDEVSIEWLADFLNLIRLTPNLDWLLLTKRPENWRSRIEAVIRLKTDGTGKGGMFWQWMVEWLGGKPPRNVWIGTSVEDQPRADERIPELLKIPAAVRFLSVEPLLGPVDIEEFFTAGGDHIDSRHWCPIDWVIVGGESGPGARPCNVEWIRDIVRQCKAAGVPCFVKQLGARPVYNRPDGGFPMFSATPTKEVPLELKHPKGGDPAEWADDLRVREFPR